MTTDFTKELPNFISAAIDKKAVFAFSHHAVLHAWAASKFTAASQEHDSESTPEPALIQETSGSTQEPTPVWEPSESTQEPAPVWEPSESTQEPTSVQVSSESTQEHAPVREPLESTPESTPESAPVWEPSESSPEPAPVQEPSEFASEPAPIYEFAPEHALVHAEVFNPAPGDPLSQKVYFQPASAHLPAIFKQPWGAWLAALGVFD